MNKAQFIQFGKNPFSYISLVVLLVILLLAMKPAEYEQFTATINPYTPVAYNEAIETHPGQYEIQYTISGIDQESKKQVDLKFYLGRDFVGKRLLEKRDSSFFKDKAYDVSGYIQDNQFVINNVGINSYIKY